MTVTFCLDPGPIAVHATYWVIIGLAVTVSWWASKIKADRAWTKSLAKAHESAWTAPWQAMGEPVVLSRCDAEATIFKRRPYREEGFEWRLAA